MIRIVLCGAGGRMGQNLRTLIEREEDLALVGGIDRDTLDGVDAARLGCPAVHSPAEAAVLLRECDVLIDFSSPAALRAVLDHAGAALSGKAIVVGTTGLGSEEQARLDDAATRSPVLAAANFSVGVNLLLNLAEAAARVLGEDRFDVEITETHHRRKVDAPSGTALALARAVAQGRGAALEELRRDGRSGQTGVRPQGEIGLHALRGGSVVGEHRVQFLGDAERIELAHIATDRALFAEGALLAARWLQGRAPGRYHMSDVLGF